MISNKWKNLTIAAGVAALVTGFAINATAAIKKPANYPQRPITVIVCFGKGGGADQAAEALQGPAEKIMGIRINRISKPGGGGVNCLPDFMQAPADGYTILMQTDNLITKYVSGDTDVDPRKDVTPLLISNVAPTGLFIKPDDKRFLTNGKPDFDKVLAFAKANAGAMTVSNINSEMELVTMAKVEEFFGIKVKQVLFDKPAQRYGVVIGGKLDVLMEQPGDVIKHVQANKLAPVLMVWPERLSLFPDTKATGADYKMNWKPLLRVRGMWIKSDTPADIKDYLKAVFKAAYDSKEHQAFLKRKSLTIVNSFYNSEDAAKIYNDSIDTYAKIFKAMKQKVRKDLQ